MSLRFLWVPLLAAVSIAAAQTPVAKVGAQAPALRVAKWIKGSPVKQFGNGKVHVVEFWATWCVPCKVTIPHLTQLAEKYRGRATFTGVSVWETKPGSKDLSYINKVTAFVKEMGDEMDYNVAVDTLDGAVARTWLEAAGQTTIPTAFVIDQRGKIAWVGHPMGRLDEVVGRVIAGKYDSREDARIHLQAIENARREQALYEPLMVAIKTKRPVEALAELDKLEARLPGRATSLATTRYSLLLMVDETKAYALARSLAEGALRNEPLALNQIAWAIVDDTSKLKRPDYATAVSIARRANELTDSQNAFILDTLAYALFKSGDVDGAIDWQERAVAIASRDASVDAMTRKEIRERLKLFKAKKSKPEA